MDTGQELQDRLRKRRKAMNITMHTTDSSQNIETVGDDGTDAEDDIPTQLVEEDIENLDDSDADEVTSRLKEKIESRHDATRKRLQKSEIHARPEISPRSKPQGETPSIIPAISTGHSQELASPRSDMDSTLGSNLGRSTGTRSLRSRLQEKVQAAKQQRTKSPMTEERKRTMRLKDRINYSTRFDDPLHLLSRPELEKEKELESKVLAKLHWKKVLHKARQQMGQPNESQCYDFFTKQFEEVSSELEPSADEPSTEPTEEPTSEAVPTDQPTPAVQDESPETREIVEGVVEETEEVEEDKKKLLTEVIPEELDWKLVNITAAEYAGYRARLEAEEKVSYVPSLLDAPTESKVLSDHVLVYLEEEGFYVGLMPEVQIRNRNILENRILRHENLDHESWFGSDGRVKILPSPIKMISTNPWVAGLEDIDPSIETIYVKAYESSVEEKYMKNTEEYELHVDIGTTVFHHHPLMSREHVLASEMSEMYEEYIRHKHRNYEVFFHEKLRTLRLALRTMKRNASAAEEDLSVLGGQELRIQDYFTEIRRTCHQRDRSEAFERELMKNIMAEWKEIKHLRIIQAFNNTSIKLTVKKQEVNENTDSKQWQQEINLQVEESAEEYEYNIQYPYRKAMAQYQNDLQEWKKTNLKLKRQQQRVAALSEDSEAHISSAKEDVVGVNPKPLKPLPPAKFDEEAVRKTLISQALQHRRNPGEPKISLEVTNTGTVTPNNQVPDGEAVRRHALQNYTMIARVKFNGRDVCSSETKSITSDFRVHFGQIFKIMISQWPDSLKVQLFEAGRLSNTMLDEISLPVPDGSVNSANAQIFPADFSTDRIISYPTHEGVGSNTPFILRKDAAVPVVLKTRGQLFVSVCWGLSKEGNVRAPKLLSQQGADSLETEGRPQARTHPSGQHDALHIRDSEIRTLWSQEGKLDPNDPANSGLLTFANTKEGFAPAMDYFRLDQLQEQFNFVTDEEIVSARRFKILEYRAKGISEFRNISMIPANEHEILDSAFTAYERHKREKDDLGDAAEKKVAAGTLSTHRLEVLRFRQRVRDSVIRRFYTARHYHTLQDMVQEDQVPDIGTLGINILKTLEPRRPLRPSRTERKKATAQNLTEGSVKILVVVVRAYNLPVRNRMTLPGAEGSLAAAMTGASLSPQYQSDDEPCKLSPFVSVSFQGSVKTTTVAHGPNPSWNEELEVSVHCIGPGHSGIAGNINRTGMPVTEHLDFLAMLGRYFAVFCDVEYPRSSNAFPVQYTTLLVGNGSSCLAFSAPSNDYNPESLQTIDETLFIHVFDRIVMDANIDKRDRNEIGETSGVATGIVSHRIQNHWLGSLKVPFSTIYQQAKIDGTFKLNVPIMMLGYTAERGRMTSTDPYDQMESQLLQPQEGSYLTVFVTLEPELGHPEPAPQKFETQEDHRLIDESLKFMEECKNKFPKRRVKTTVIDINGESVFVTRYIKPLPPPPSLLEGSSQDSLITARRLARYVSQIPFVSDNVIYADTCDLWSTCDQFLNMLCGDEEEHAILLVNYFLHIGKQAYLVLGNAIPEGETAYVLTLEMSQDYLLWNASTGQHYKTKDSLCPLQGVHALVNQDNIWFNMQTHEMPSRIHFNVNKGGWKPLFKSDTVARGLPSVQPDSLTYPETDLVYVQNLEERIERSLKDSVMNWRPRHVTRWNRACSTSLRQILQGLETDRIRYTSSTDESAAQSQRVLTQDDHTERLRKLIGGARFVGFPMDMPYTDVNSIIKAVHSTEVHKIQDTDVEFALAVYVHPYPASVLCVWVYIAALNGRMPY